jgi:putative acetyltransferase
MIYLIGGPGCSGKTTLAWRLLRQIHIPFFSLDYLMMGLHHGAPALGVDPNQPELLVAPKVWQVCKPMLVAMLENGENYCLEGFAITPDHADQLFELFPDNLRVCFLGYCTVDLDEKWQNERRYRQNNT